jgi:UDP-N-acetylglucosamine 2-epimerase (non-hydrolysing)
MAEKLGFRWNESGRDGGRFIVLEPLGYLEFLSLQAEARLILTDSGGIQEESMVLGVPCLTLRENTERPITLQHGANVLVGHSRSKILIEARRVLARPVEPPRAPKLWDGKAGERIAAILSSMRRPERRLPGASF